MRTRYTLRIALPRVGLVFPSIGLAGNGVTPRPRSDFLDRQGTTTSDFDLVPDYVG